MVSLIKVFSSKKFETALTISLIVKTFLTFKFWNQNQVKRLKYRFNLYFNSKEFICKLSFIFLVTGVSSLTFTNSNTSRGSGYGGRRPSNRGRGGSFRGKSEMMNGEGRGDYGGGRGDYGGGRGGRGYQNNRGKECTDFFTFLVQ